jgi:hypothetical protein
MPVPNLLQWLHHEFPQCSDAHLLRIYHELINRRDWLITQSDAPKQQNLNTVRVTYYPHAIEMESDES